MIDGYERRVAPADENEDEDITQEKQRLLTSEEECDNSVVLLKDMKKVYYTGKYAVKGVSLGIPNGECFGLLGINGAGESRF